MRYTLLASFRRSLRNGSSTAASLKPSTKLVHPLQRIQTSCPTTGFRSISMSAPRRNAGGFPGGKERAALGVFTPTAAGLFIATGIGLFYYFRHEKQKLLEQRQKELEDSQVGRPNVGGPFTLTSHKGEPFTEKDLLGKWSLIYFGFTNCPDICPEELDKMSAAVEELDKQYGPIVQPIFISVDPARDSVPQVARYVSEFHPRLTGLTGEYQTVKATCKAYRVYFSTPPNTKPGDDYLVDHSIFFYFMDPNGRFVDAFGKATTMEDVVARVQKEITSWEGREGKTT